MNKEFFDHASHVGILNIEWPTFLAFEAEALEPSGTCPRFRTSLLEAGDVDQNSVVFFVACHPIQSVRRLFRLGTGGPIKGWHEGSSFLEARRPVTASWKLCKSTLNKLVFRNGPLPDSMLISSVEA